MQKMIKLQSGIARLTALLMMLALLAIAGVAAAKFYSGDAGMTAGGAAIGATSVGQTRNVNHKSYGNNDIRYGKRLLNNRDLGATSAAIQTKPAYSKTAGRSLGHHNAIAKAGNKRLLLNRHAKYRIIPRGKQVNTGG